jgi:hypothetical protein
VSDSHTKEPWIHRKRLIRKRTRFTEIDGETEVTLGVMKTPIVPKAYGVFGYDVKAARANARRIVACVNLLAGMETEQIEWMLAEKFRLFSERSDSEGNRHLKFLRNP